MPRPPLGHDCTHLEVELTAGAAHQAASEDRLGVDLAGQVDGEGVLMETMLSLRAAVVALAT